MRPLLIAFTALAITSMHVTAQDEDVLRPNGRPAHLGASTKSHRGSPSPFTIGIEGGMNLSFFGQNINGALSTSPLQVFGFGSGIAPFASFFVDVALSDRIGLQARVAYDAKSYGNERDGLIDCVVIDEYGNETLVTTANVNNEYTAKLTYVTFTSSIRIEPIDRLVILAGPTFQVRASSEVTTFTQTIVDENSDCYFNFNTPEQSKTQTGTDTVDTGLEETRIGLDISVGYRIPLSPSIDLVPRVGYQWMFTPTAPDSDPFEDQTRARTDGIRVVTATDRYLNSLQAVLGLWIRL